MTTEITAVPRILPWTESELSQKYDLFLGVIGYEERARHILAKYSPAASRKLAIGFTDRHVLHYEENAQWYCQAGYEVRHLSDVEFKSIWWEELKRLASQCEGGQTLKICIDISSITRSRIAYLIDGLRQYVAFQGTAIDFVYSLAEFSRPSEHQPPNIHVGPVIPAFAGWWTEPDRVTTLVVGLGYEQDKALGAVEHLQPGEVYLFAPESPIPEYAPIVQKANKILLQIVPKSHRMRYRVDQPFNALVTIESIVDRLLRESNVILLPFGPKLFALHCLLVAWIHPDAAVWRVSAGKTEEPQDRKASGYVYGVRLVF